MQTLDTTLWFLAHEVSSLQDVSPPEASFPASFTSSLVQAVQTLDTTFSFAPQSVGAQEVTPALGMSPALLVLPAGQSTHRLLELTFWLMVQGRLSSDPRHGGKVVAQVSPSLDPRQLPSIIAHPTSSHHSSPAPLPPITTTLPHSSTGTSLVLSSASTQQPNPSPSPHAAGHVRDPPAATS